MPETKFIVEIFKKARGNYERIKKAEDVRKLEENILIST